MGAAVAINFTVAQVSCKKLRSSKVQKYHYYRLQHHRSDGPSDLEPSVCNCTPPCVGGYLTFPALTLHKQITIFYKITTTMINGNLMLIIIQNIDSLSTLTESKFQSL